jgi:DNA-binding transcriptional regulator YhcF (GntR family)
MSRDEHEITFGLPSVGIPAEVLFHPYLSATEKILFGYIRNLAQSSKGCWASNRWLGQFLHVGTQTVSNGVSNLRDYGFLIVEFSNKSGTSEQNRSIFINDHFTARYRFMVKTIHDALEKFGYVPDEDMTRIKNFIDPSQKITKKGEREEESKPKSKTSLSQLAVATVEAEELLSGVRERNKRYHSFAQKLDEILQLLGRKKQRESTLQSWANDFRLLHTADEIDPTTIRKALEWYAVNIGKEYIPECYSGKSFRSKFSKLQSAIQRSKRPQRGERIGYGHVAKERIYHKPLMTIDNTEN